MRSRSTTRHGVSGKVSARKRVIFWFIGAGTQRQKRRSAGGCGSDSLLPLGRDPSSNERRAGDGGLAWPKRPRRVAFPLSQTAWVDGPAAAPALAGAAKKRVRAGRDGPDRDCN